MKMQCEIRHWIVAIIIAMTADLCMFAQGKPPVATIEAQNSTVEQVLRSIESQTSYRFAYKTALLKQLPKVNLKCKDTPVKNILDKIFANTAVSYRIVSPKSIIIEAKTADKTPATAPKNISGTITGPDGEPLIGATIMADGAQQGTITDIDGKFNLSGIKEGQSVSVAYVGFTPLTFTVGKNNVYNYKMQENTENLEEVVVVGYGSMKKRDLSGAVGQLKGSDLMKGNPTDFGRGLQGKIAGVEVTQNDGAPGGGISIQVRGANSFSTSSQPLYIVDGVPFDTGSDPSRSETNYDSNNNSNPLAFINPHDIESIEVLKDASAAAIYGSRGANGVILITTKRGEKGYDNVEFSANFSFSRIGKKVSTLDPVTYARYRNEQMENGAIYNNRPYSDLPFPGQWYYKEDEDGNILSGEYSPAPDDFLNPEWYTDENGFKTWVGGSDWQDLIYQNGFSQEYNITVSGGSDRGWYSFSGNYLNQRGIIKKSGFTRYSIRASLGRKINSWLDMGTNINFTNTDTDFSRTNSYEYGVIRSSLVFPPNYDPLHMDDVPEEEYNWLASNPYAYINDSYDNIRAVNVFTSSYLEATILPCLKFRQNIGISYSGRDRGTYYGRQTQEGSGSFGINGKGSKADNWYNSITSESLITFDKRFGMHSLNAVGGFTAEKISWGSKSMSATDFPNDNTLYHDMSLGKNQGKLESDRGESTMASFLGRVNYIFNDRYILTASYRADGSSKFTEKNKWAHFFSAAVAWRLSEEKFIRDLGLFSNLKLRLSYGETGNQSIGSYRTLPMLFAAQYPFGGSLSNGFANVEWRGPASGDLRWETTRQFDIGIDMSFLNNRISFTADYYRKKTRDLLQEVIIAPSNGFNRKMVNSAYVTNDGLELSGSFVILAYTPVRWNMKANISFNRNKIGGLPLDQYATRLWHAADQVFIQRNGYPIGAIYGYVEDGFYDNLAEVMADPDPAIRKKGLAMVGEIKYRDLDGQPGITASDRTIIGDTNPDFVYGITNNLEWKNFTLSIFFQGSYGNDIFNGNLMDVQMGNINNIPVFAYNERWSKDNTSGARWPKPVQGYEREWKISDRYVEDGSYLKLKDLTIGYNLNNPVKGIKGIKLYASASNLFTITKYRWFDPEVNSFGSDASRRGVDCYSYPSSRTYSVGLNVSF
ncbi:TonB-dependent receptor [Heminiphilus faecis]|uniref:TonB-dependent receptor n=1 Tax=Heminiphilus faecis TaxID=2601703 RepID=A0ABV4CXX0_9BACT